MRGICSAQPGGLVTNIFLGDTSCTKSRKDGRFLSDLIPGKHVSLSLPKQDPESCSSLSSLAPAVSLQW